MPAPSPIPSTPPPAPQSAVRASVERLSLPALQRMVRLPRAVPFLALLALLVVSIAVRGPLGLVCTLLVTAVVAWLLYLSWPRLTGVERLGRCAVLVLASALCVVQIFPPS